MKHLLLMVALATSGLIALGDDFIAAPSRGQPGGTLYPFLLKQTAQSANPFFTMRYQQVYNRSLFTNINPDSIYLTILNFGFLSSAAGYTLKMQINLSTTSKSADGLSAVFSDN